MILSEVLYNEETHKVGCKLDNLQATDSKSLYDANPNLTDKRSLVNVRAIQEVITPKQTRWVPTCTDTPHLRRWFHEVERNTSFESHALAAESISTVDRWKDRWIKEEFCQ